jgi:Cu/Ag efflux protein CusF
VASTCDEPGARISSEDIMSISRRNLLASVSCLLVSASVAATARAEAQDKKEYVFKGKIEKVDPRAKTLTVANENIPGWMSAMSMTYGVDKEAVLKDVHEGDQITATVYENNFKTLYNVKVVPPDKKK